MCCIPLLWRDVFPGTSICVNCLHPGVVATNLLPRWLRLIKPLLSPVILDDERGARTTLLWALRRRGSCRHSPDCISMRTRNLNLQLQATLDEELQENILWSKSFPMGRARSMTRRLQTRSRIDKLAGIFCSCETTSPNRKPLGMKPLSRDEPTAPPQSRVKELLLLFCRG